MRPAIQQNSKEIKEKHKTGIIDFNLNNFLLKRKSPIPDKYNNPKNIGEK